MGRSAGSIMVAVLLGAVPALVPSPALAIVAGEVGFRCRAEMPEFPSPSASGSCTNDLLSPIAAVEAQGQDDQDGEPFVVAGPGELHAEFSYSLPCIAGEPLLVGPAAGTAIVQDVPAFANGGTTTADLTFTWSATLAGTAMVITLHGGSLAFANGGSAAIASGAGAGTLVPFLGTGNVCPVGGPLEGLVQGEVNLLP